MNTAALVVLSGFATTMALIAAIGAQNAFVLRQGIRGEHVLPVVALCTVSDLVLIFAGIAGFGALVAAHPDIVTIARYCGAAFLAAYGMLATCLALTFLNPHVYLDTVVLLGALANEHRESRWLFGIGAVAASAVWFTGLGFGAKRLGRFFASPTTWRALDTTIAVTMWALAAALVLNR